MTSVIYIQEVIPKINQIIMLKIQIVAAFIVVATVCIFLCSEIRIIKQKFGYRKNQIFFIMYLVDARVGLRI